MKAARHFSQLTRRQKRIVTSQMKGEGFTASDPKFKYTFRNISPNQISASFLPKKGTITRSIETKGFSKDSPILVFREGKGFQLVGGFHRFSAVKELQKTGKIREDFRIPSVVISYSPKRALERMLDLE